MSTPTERLEIATSGYFAILNAIVLLGLAFAHYVWRPSKPRRREVLLALAKKKEDDSRGDVSENWRTFFFSWMGIAARDIAAFIASGLFFVSVLYLGAAGHFVDTDTPKEALYKIFPGVADTASYFVAAFAVLIGSQGFLSMYNYFFYTVHRFEGGALKKPGGWGLGGGIVFALLFFAAALTGAILAIPFLQVGFIVMLFIYAAYALLVLIGAVAAWMSVGSGLLYDDYLQKASTGKSFAPLA